MSVLNIPRHIPADADRFKTFFQELFKLGNISRVVCGRESGYPNEVFLSSGRTLAPYVIVCLKGTIQIGYLKGGTVVKEPLSCTEAVFMKTDTWIHCDHSSAPLYLRITLDDDHTLFGGEEKTEYRPLTHGSTDRLELYPCPHLPLPHTRTLVHRLESPGEQAPHSPWELHAINLLLTDLYELLFLEPLKDQHTGKARRTWQTIRGYLQEHCMLPLSRKNVAEAFRISPNHISRLFNEFSETGFNETLELLRMERAVRLLRTSNLTISEIAYECGYSGANYFIRAFRTHYDLTPGKYQEAMRMQVPPPVFSILETPAPAPLD